MKTGKPIPERVFNAQKGGFVTGADSIVDDSLQMSQAQINAILMGDAINVSLSATPSPVFVGVQYTISLVASVNTAANSIIIKIRQHHSIGCRQHHVFSRIHCRLYDQNHIKKRYRGLSYTNRHRSKLCGRNTAEHAQDQPSRHIQYQCCSERQLCMVQRAFINDNSRCNNERLRIPARSTNQCDNQWRGVQKLSKQQHL